jgi:hypothetical protein
MRPRSCCCHLSQDAAKASLSRKKGKQKQKEGSGPQERTVDSAEAAMRALILVRAVRTVAGHRCTDAEPTSHSSQTAKQSTQLWCIAPVKGASAVQPAATCPTHATSMHCIQIVSDCGLQEEEKAAAASPSKAARLKGKQAAKPSAAAGKAGAATEPSTAAAVAEAAAAGPAVVPTAQQWMRCPITQVRSPASGVNLFAIAISSTLSATFTTCLYCNRHPGVRHLCHCNAAALSCHLPWQRHIRLCKLPLSWRAVRLVSVSWCACGSAASQACGSASSQARLP